MAQRRRFARPTLLLWPFILLLSAAVPVVLAAPTNKSLIKAANNPTVYWYQNDKYYPVIASSLDIMQNNSMPGWSWASITTLPSIFLPRGPNQDFISTGSSSNGLLIKLRTDPAVYLVKDGKREFLSLDIFNARGYSFNDVIDVPQQILNMFPELPRPDFTISTGVTSYTIAQGETVSIGITVNGSNGFNSPVELFGYNFPPNYVPQGTGWTPQVVTPPPTSPGAFATLKIVTSSSTQVGTRTITLEGRGGGLTRQKNVSLTVNSAPSNLTGTLSPSNPIVGVTNVSIIGTATPNSTVTETDIGPDGATNGPFSTPVNSSGNYSMGPFLLTQLGTYTGTLRDSVSGQTRTITYSGAGDFSSSVDTRSRTVIAGQPASYTVTFSSIGGFRGTVIPAALDWSKVTGATASWLPSQVTVPSNGSVQSTFTIQTAVSTPVGTYSNIILLGKNGEFSRGAPTVSLTVNPGSGQTACGTEADIKQDITNIFRVSAPPEDIRGATAVHAVLQFKFQQYEELYSSAYDLFNLTQDSLVLASRSVRVGDLVSACKQVQRARKYNDLKTRMETASLDLWMDREAGVAEVLEAVRDGCKWSLAIGSIGVTGPAATLLAFKITTASELLGVPIEYGSDYFAYGKDQAIVNAKENITAAALNIALKIKPAGKPSMVDGLFKKGLGHKVNKQQLYSLLEQSVRDPQFHGELVQALSHLLPGYTSIALEQLATEYVTKLLETLSESQGGGDSFVLLSKDGPHALAANAAPYVVSTSPENAAAYVSHSLTSITATFNENIQLNTSAVTLLDSNGTAVPISQVSAAGDTMTLSLSSALGFSTSYKIIIQPDAVRNIFGTSNARYEGYFTTLSSSLSVGSRVIVANTGGVGLNLRETPNEVGSIAVRGNSEGTRMSIIGGPVLADGYKWWNVRLDESGQTGWSATGDWLTPTDSAGLRVGANVVIANTNNYGLRLRNRPGLSSTIIKTLSEGAQMTIIGGPYYVDGYLWWNVTGSAGTGFSAVAYWLFPDIASNPNTLAIFSVEPSGIQTRDWGGTVTYTIAVKDSRGNPVSGAVVSGQDDLRGGLFSTVPSLTDSNGQITYATMVPNGKANGTYNIFFIASKTAFPDSVQVTRQVRVSHTTTPTTVPAQMTSPANGSTFPSQTVTFNWSLGTGNTQYFLTVGNSLGSGEYFNNYISGGASTIGGLPKDNRTIYVGLWSLSNGQWFHNDYTYKACSGCGGQLAQITSPANGSTFTSRTVTFNWSPGNGNTQYFLTVGNAPGSAEYFNNYISGGASTVGGLPEDNRTIYVGLWSLGNGQWLHNDYTYKACSSCAGQLAQMTSPANGSTFPSRTVTFNWNPGTGNSQYFLTVGNTLGSTEYFNNLISGATTTVGGLPEDNRTIYVGLWSLRNGQWLHNDYTYKACSGCGSQMAQMTSPANGSTFDSTMVTFNWSQGTGNSQFYLTVGNGPGTTEYFNNYVSGGTTAVGGLPADNRTIYVGLWSLRNGQWLHNDYTFKACNSCIGQVAQITSPANGSVFTSRTVTFNWNPGTGNSQYYLTVGNSLGSSEYFNNYTSGGTSTVGGLPGDRRTIYVSLWSLRNGQWLHRDYTYNACNNCTPLADITSPTNGSTFLSTTVNFNWGLGTGNSQYFLYVGNSPGSSEYFYNYISGGSTVVGGLPGDGRNIYVRLWSLSPSGWTYLDYNYRACACFGNQLPQISNPINASKFTSTIVNFSWTPGTGGSQYFLYVGNSVGSSEYFYNYISGSSASVAGLPSDGRAIYVRIWSLLPTGWTYSDYVYKAAG